MMKPDGTAVKVPIRFRGVKVYDHNQTEGEEIPQPDTSEMMKELECNISDRALS